MINTAGKLFKLYFIAIAKNICLTICFRHLTISESLVYTWLIYIIFMGRQEDKNVKSPYK